MRRGKRLPIGERMSFVFLEYGRLDVLDGAFVLVDSYGVRTHIPVGALACLFLEPGTRVSHAAAVLAADVGCLLVWVGEGAVRVYSAGRPGGARSDRLLYQAKLALDEQARLAVVRDMFARRFGQAAPQRRSVEQLRGIEGGRVKEMYKQHARQHGVTWHGRRYDPTDWKRADVPNRCVSAATSCLYGVTEAAILAAGYSPAIGFLHSGKPKSFVYDIADIIKFDTVIPAAFRVAKDNPANPESATRHACRDAFRQSRTLAGLVPLIHAVLDAGGLAPPKPPADAVGPAFGEASDDLGEES